MTIQQYALQYNSVPQSFNIPGFDQVLKVGENVHGQMSIWVAQDSTRPNVVVTFQMIEEGQAAPTLGTFIGAATIHPLVAGFPELHEMFVWQA